MVEVGTGTAGTRFVNKDWPIDEGLELGTSKIDGKEMSLEPWESNVLSRYKEGL